MITLKINVDSEEIKALASQLHDCSFSLETEIKNITNIISNISTVWTGNDATKYVNIMQEKYVLGLEELKNIIDEYAVYLNNIPEAYEILDNVYSNKHMEV